MAAHFERHALLQGLDPLQRLADRKCIDANQWMPQEMLAAKG
jgi:hypothetical protein